MIIGLAGFAGAGKDTVGSILVERHGYRRIGFADKVRALALEINPMVWDSEARQYSELRHVVERLEWDSAKRRPEVRELLQRIGQGVRDTLSSDAWIDAALCDVSFSDRVVVTDVRYPNETGAIREMGGDVWYVRRPGVEPANSHVSEISIRPDMCDMYIVNDSTVAALGGSVANALHDAMKHRGRL